MVGDDTLEPTEAPRPISGSRQQAAVIFQVAQAPNHIFLGCTPGGLHHVDNKSIAGIHAFSVISGIM
jgi:hypothetical protein